MGKKAVLTSEEVSKIERAVSAQVEAGDRPITGERTAPKEGIKQLDSVKSATKTKELGRGEGQTGRYSPVRERDTPQGEGGKVGR